MSNPLVDMEKPDVIFAIGTNMTECHPVAATRLKKAIAGGAKMIVADPRRIRLAELADLYLPIKVGTDTALLLGMAHVIARDGLVDWDFISERTEGIEAFLAHIDDKTPQWASKICGVPAEDIETAARWYASADKGAIFYTLGITEHICGVQNVQSLSNLALLAGQVGREGTGINPMRGQNNVQGCGDAGALPNNYPGFQSVLEEGHRRKFAEAYGAEMEPEKGFTKIAALHKAIDGDLGAMLIVGENTVASDADRQHCEQALKALDHLVVVDIFLNETGELADVVLPASSWGETDGVFVNTERRLQRVRKAAEPQGEARPEWWIIAEIAKRMGSDQFHYESAKDVFNELCSLSPIYAGVDWDMIDDGAYQWPIPYKGHPGTPRLHEGRFPSGRGKFVTPDYRPPGESTSRKFPVWLTTGRRLMHYHTATMTGRSEGIDYLQRREELEVHPDDVEAWGLTDGDAVKLSSPRGSVEVAVKATRRSPRGTVFCSFSFGDVPINDLIGSSYDPVTETAEFKVCPVRIEALA
jgi:predicted molibdopterin-dependent oxidoreductase YjgC